MLNILLENTVVKLNTSRYVSVLIWWRQHQDGGD